MLPNGAGFHNVEYDDPRATQCITTTRTIQPAAIWGNGRKVTSHTHSTKAGEDCYACFDSVNMDGRWVKRRKLSGDPDAMAGKSTSVKPRFTDFPRDT